MNKTIERVKIFSSSVGVGDNVVEGKMRNVFQNLSPLMGINHTLSFGGTSHHIGLILNQLFLTIFQLLEGPMLTNSLPCYRSY